MNFVNIQFVQGDSIFARINKLSDKYEYFSENIECDVIILKKIWYKLGWCNNSVLFVILGWWW